jgi:two-component system, cell cycle sensor histidine kinase and response regulator CckA
MMSEPAGRGGPRYPALSVMALDILRNALALSDRAGEMTAYVAQELRELSGAKTVLLMRCDEDSGTGCTAVSVCPERRAHLAADPAIQDFARQVRDAVSEVIILKPGGGDVPTTELGVPLRTRGETVGVLLLLGLPDAQATDAVLDTLTMLSTVMALVLRNALLYEGQERTISERTQELAKSEARLQLALESSGEALWEWDLSSPDLYFSEKVYAMLGRDPGSFMMPLNSWQALIHPDDRDRAANAERGLHAEGWDRHSIEYRMLSAEGEYCWYQASAKVVGRHEDGAPSHLIGTIRDITERVQAEAQLQQAQKMESVGRLAGGVAHDFNNLLTVINGYSQLLLAKLSASDPIRVSIAEIHKAGERAAGLTQQLLAFSRKQVLQPRRLDVNRVVKEMRPMLERLMGEDVDVGVALDAAGGTVHADPHQLEQVLMNLAVNARDAMPGGGKLLIKTARVEWDESWTRSHPEAHAGSYVMLEVSDNGTGMDEETRQRIFEPFFTTKGVGQGTGLGLSMVQGIVAQSGGHINVYSEPDRGTTFKIYLPALAEAAADTRRQAAVPALGGDETVLVVEDQAEVRKYAVAVLKAYGYRVIPAENAGEALMLCEQERERIDLVLTDVVMPNVSGRELANRLEEMRPGIKVLFMSGYTDDAIVSHGVLEESAELIQKPFSPAELAGKVRTILGASVARSKPVSAEALKPRMY